MSQDEIVTQTLTGNGLLIERTEKPGGLVPWWWVQDERRVPKALSQTYRHRETLKANGCRWSKKRASWYYMGVELPAAIAALVRPQDTANLPDEPSGVTPLAVPPQPMVDPYEAARRFREERQTAALRRFADRFQADLDRVTRYPALPAVATIRLDDPWA